MPMVQQLIYMALKNVITDIIIEKKRAKTHVQNFLLLKKRRQSENVGFGPLVDYKMQ